MQSGHRNDQGDPQEYAGDQAGYQGHPGDLRRRKGERIEQYHRQGEEVHVPPVAVPDVLGERMPLGHLPPEPVTERDGGQQRPGRPRSPGR